MKFPLRFISQFLFFSEITVVNSYRVFIWIFMHVPYYTWPRYFDSRYYEHMQKMWFKVMAQTDENKKASSSLIIQAFVLLLISKIFLAMFQYFDDLQTLLVKIQLLFPRGCFVSSPVIGLCCMSEMWVTNVFQIRLMSTSLALHISAIYHHLITEKVLVLNISFRKEEFPAL